MRRHNEKLFATWFLTLTIVGGLCAPATALADAQVIAVVVDRDNPVSDIGVEALRSLFLGKRREWADGTRAVPVDLESGPPHHAFCSTRTTNATGSTRRSAALGPGPDSSPLRAW